MGASEDKFPGAAQCAADLAKIGVEAGYRAGLIAGLREIEPEIRKHERAAPVMVAEMLDAIRARIAALETEGETDARRKA